MNTPYHKNSLRRWLPMMAVGLCHTATAAEPLFSLAAAPDHYQLGTAFAVVGDLNGDGVPDIAVSAPATMVDSLFGSGIVHVVSGTDGATLRNYTGSPQENQMFGHSLAALDADGDGIPDLAIGAPGQSGINGHGAGAVEIFSGADGSLILAIQGPDHSNFGAAIANAGDQDGDGIDDLYVGAPQADGGGAVYLVSAASGATLRVTASDTPDAAFGARIAMAGDIDGDGLADVVIGAPMFRTPEGNPVGKVSLVRSSDGVVAASVSGPGDYSQLGSSLATARDANADGLPDILAGTASGGTALVLSGADLTTIADLSIPLPEFWDLTVGGSLDYDQDGTADWLIGSPAMSVSGFEVFGGIRVVSGTDQSTLYEYQAAEPYTGLGWNLAVLRGFGMAAGEIEWFDPVGGGSGLAHFWRVEEADDDGGGDDGGGDDGGGDDGGGDDGGGGGDDGGGDDGEIQDRDGDGVADADDLVPDSIMDETVVLLGLDSGVDNRVDARGVTLADRYAMLGGLSDYRNPALYAVAAKQLGKDLLKGGLLDKAESRMLFDTIQQGMLKAVRTH
jgi:hypothetical protein